jgi:hypothetical protein
MDKLSEIEKVPVVGVAYGLPFHVDANSEETYLEYLEAEDLTKPPWAMHPEWRPERER